MRASIGNRVSVEFVCMLDDGTVIDSSSQHDPLQFELGMGRLIERLENELIGLVPGEEKEIMLENAYGRHDPGKVVSVPRSSLGRVRAGDMTFITSQGVSSPARIVAVAQDEVLLDINHPLAGKTLKFRLKIGNIA